MCCQTRLDVRNALNFRLFGSGRIGAILGIVAGRRLSVGLSLVVVGQDSLMVLLSNVLWNPFHAENLDVETGSVGKSIVNSREIFLVDLTHVNTQSTSGVQSSAASFALEMFCFLMVDQHLEIIKV